jgi:hypothetical protein
MGPCVPRGLSKGRLTRPSESYADAGPEGPGCQRTNKERASAADLKATRDQARGDADRAFAHIKRIGPAIPLESLRQRAWHPARSHAPARKRGRPRGGCLEGGTVAPAAGRPGEGTLSTPGSTWRERGSRS